MSLPIVPEPPAVDVEVWWTAPDPSDAALDLLDEVERGRHDRYLRAEDRARFRTARALAKNLLARRVGVRPEEIRLDSTCKCGEPHGKPRLAGSGLELSISHSGDWIVVAVTAGAPVGVDVEQAPKDAVADGMLEATLSPRELSSLRSLSAAGRDEAFLAYWTRKEALLKATGEGLATPMPGITVTGPTERARLLDPGESTADPGRIRMADLGARPGYRACVAVLTTNELRVSEQDADVTAVSAD
jgi:4'-phosphopantetheinyl transferase